jgi:gamma-glutamylcyclotransferase (GGCT)/AIG2-like uncharacterized protein YtfP
MPIIQPPPGLEVEQRLDANHRTRWLGAYGTLRTLNGVRHPYLPPRVDEHPRPYYIKGRLYVMPNGIPAFRYDPNSRSSVKITLFHVDWETLAQLDVLEGYCRTHPERSVYRRISIPSYHNQACTESPLNETTVYEFNGTVPAGWHYPPGDYLQWREGEERRRLARRIRIHE